MEEKDEEDEDTDIESEEDIVEIFELFWCARHHCKRKRKLFKTHVPRSLIQWIWQICGINVQKSCKFDKPLMICMQKFSENWIAG